MKVMVGRISLLVLFSTSVFSQTSQLRTGEALVLSREDGSGMVMVANDDPVIRLQEVDGAVAAVRVTPLDGAGAVVGGGRLLMIGPNEKRDMRLRDEFAADTLRNASLRIELLQGDGRVDVSSAEVHGQGLKPRPSATTSRGRAVRSRPTAPTSRTLIDRAEAAGKIDSETALLYRVYDIFSDARLPHEYLGDDSEITEGMYLSEVVNRYPTLSAATQAAVAPFLIPPAYADSWANSARAVPGAALVAPICSQLDVRWGWVDSSNGAVRVFYNQDEPDASRARDIAILVDTTIWTGLSGLMKNHLPKSDGGRLCNGGDGRLDLYLTDIARSHAVSFLGCQDTPAFIEMTRTAADSVAIHEIMHAFQFSYPLKGCLNQVAYDWWTEGTAVFAQDFVSSLADDEHANAKVLLDKPRESLDVSDDSHEYGAYLLPFFVHRSTKSTDFVSAVWEACATQPALEAFDHTVAGGFEKVWFDFVRFNVNREGFDEYLKWDRLRHFAKSDGGATLFSGGMDVVDPITADLPRLSAVYKHYLFSGTEWSSVAFWNGINFNLRLHEPVPGAGVQYDPTDGDAAATKGARVQALLKIGDKWTHEDWTGQPYATFCRDVKAERLQELIVIISNSEYKERNHVVKTGGGGLPVVFLSNMGCWQWKGTVTYSNPMGMNLEVNATWTRVEQSQSPPFVRYQAEGTQLWNVAGICSGSGTVPIARELSFLFTYNFVPLQGSFHRVSNANAASTSQISLNCPPNPAPVMAGLPAWITYPPLPNLGNVPGARFVKVKEDGKTIDDSYSFVDGSKWSWHFESKQQ